MARIKHPEKLDDLVKHGSLYEIQAVQRKQAIAVASTTVVKQAKYISRKTSVKISLEREFKNRRFTR